MPDLLKRLDARAERGFSMFLVIMAMFVHVDVRRRRRSRPPTATCRWPASRRSASPTYAAAEAGLNYYLNAPAAGPGLLDQVRHGRRPERDRGEPGQPAWNGAAPTRALAQDRRRRTTGTRSSCCRPRTTRPGTRTATTATPEQQSFVDMRHGHVPDPGHGPRGTERDRPQALDHRHVPARQLPELRLLHRLREPRPGGRDRRRQARRRRSRTASNKYRIAARRQGCTEIQFATGDADQRPAAHQRREPPDLRHADLRPRQDQDGTTARRTDTIEVSRRRARLRLRRAPAAAPTRRRSTRHRRSRPAPSSSRCRRPTQRSSSWLRRAAASTPA